MAADSAKIWGLFGGAGFIGQHLARSILETHPEAQIRVLDLNVPAAGEWNKGLLPYIGAGRLSSARCDVRSAEQVAAIADAFDVIVNLAAVHREPGHLPEEYFETNIKGAENLCALAERTGCTEMIFTSSISVYGVHDRPVDESTTPQPKTPYGQSKHKAESIHVDWAKRSGGRLMIVRPGVVFGPGENGNVTRLVREMLNRNRAIQLKPDQPKDGIYIHELLAAMHWLRGQDLPSGEYQLVNGVSNERLSFNAFGKALGAIRPLGNKPLNVPAALIKFASALAKPLAPLVSASSRFHPERVAKICRGNDIRPSQLEQVGYPFSWPLERSIADWLERGL